MTQQKRKKQGLFDAFVRALGDIIVVLRPYVLGGRVPKEPVTEARSRKEGGFVHYHYHRRSYADLCGRLADEWHHLPTVRAAIECLTLDKDVQKELQLVGFGDLANYIKTQIFDQFITQRNLSLATVAMPSATRSMSPRFRPACLSASS